MDFFFMVAYHIGCPKAGVALVGIRNVSLGCQISLDCIVPPVLSCLEAVKEAGPGVWNRFLTKLGALPGHDVMRLVVCYFFS
jgi:hypothetical protein